MSAQMPIRSIALAAPLLVWGMGIVVPTNAARADGCLTAPNSATPKGGHWYYHTDRTKHRKCWYLVTPDGPPPNTATQATSATAPEAHAKTSNKTSTKASKKPAPADATKPTSRAASGSSLPPPKAQSAPKPAPARNATTSEPVQPGVETKTATPSFPDAPAARTDESFQNGARAAAAAPTAPIIWPDLRPVETIKIRKPNSGPSDAAADPVSPTGAVRTLHEPADGARSGAPAKPAQTAEVASSAAVTPVAMGLAAALALAVAGILYHLVTKIAERRGGRIKIEHAPPMWADMRSERARPDDRRQPAHSQDDMRHLGHVLEALRRQEHIGEEPRPQGHVNEREHFIDELQVSLVPAANDAGGRRPMRTAIANEYGIRRPVRAAAARPNKAPDTSQDKAPRRDTGSPVADGSNVHESNLAQLIRDLDRLMQPRKDG